MPPYAIADGGDPPRPRLTSSAKLSASADFEAAAADLARVGCALFRARKVAYVAARRAASREPVETRYNGKETHNTAEPGDWIVTNMDADRRLLRDRDGNANTYVIPAATFATLYDRDIGATDFGDIFKAKGVVDAVALPGGFDIVAPWGERQQAPTGYLVRNGADVYGIHAEAFDKTYEPLT